MVHDLTRDDSRTEITSYNHIGCSSSKHRAIEVLFYEHSHHITVVIHQMKLSVDKAMGILLSRCQGVSTLVVQNMKLTDATFSDDVISIAFINSLYSNATCSSIQFLNCFLVTSKIKVITG